MGKYNAVPYNPITGINPNAAPANSRAGVLAGYVPYISWTDGAPDVVDADVSDGNEDETEGDIASIYQSIAEDSVPAKRGPGRPKKVQ